MFPKDYGFKSAEDEDREERDRRRIHQDRLTCWSSDPWHSRRRVVEKIIDPRRKSSARTFKGRVFDDT